MSIGKMNKIALLKTKKMLLDEEGFSTEEEFIVAKLRVYKEGRHGSRRWYNLAAFSEATDLFRFRYNKSLNINLDCYIIFDDEKYEIISVRNVNEKNMYIEVLAKKVEPING